MKKLVIGVITRRRSKSLARLLESLRKMQRPAEAELMFCVVENDHERNSATVIDKFSSVVTEPVLYDLEIRPGVAVARNKVVERAIETGADFLAFVDDDEQVDSHWCNALFQGMVRDRLDLAGGPSCFFWNGAEKSKRQQAVFNFFESRKLRSNSINLIGADGYIPGDIYTHNWMVRLAFLEAHGLRFDERLNKSGGEDTALSRAIRSYGGRMGWVSDAITHEELPDERLTLGYLYRRSRDQVVVSNILRGRSGVSLLPQAMLRLAEACVVGLTVPVMGLEQGARAAYKLGRAAGNVNTLLRRSSEHYGESV